MSSKVSCHPEHALIGSERTMAVTNGGERNKKAVIGITVARVSGHIHSANRPPARPTPCPLYGCQCPLLQSGARAGQ